MKQKQMQRFVEFVDNVNTWVFTEIVAAHGHVIAIRDRSALSHRANQQDR